MTRGPANGLPLAKLPEYVFDRTREYAVSIFACDEYSVHGADHWRRVEAVGLELCEESGGDPEIVRLFALLHDSCRLNDGADRLHGPRAADMLSEISGELFTLEPNRLELLEFAIRHHTGGQISGELTIGTCWDADRLDLGRVGTVPHPRYMSTEPGLQQAKLIRDKYRSIRNHNHRHRQR